MIENVEEARVYISQFHKLIGRSPITFVDFPDGRIWIKNMDDKQALRVANGLLAIELEATRKVPRQ